MIQNLFVGGEAANLTGAAIQIKILVLTVIEMKK